MNGMGKTWPVCDEHEGWAMKYLSAVLKSTQQYEETSGELVHFYLTDNTPILQSYTLCKAPFTGCKNPATQRFEFRA